MAAISCSASAWRWLCLQRGAGATWPLIALLVLMWAGLFFSYSQSSFAALLVVTLWLAFATGGRRDAHRSRIAGTWPPCSSGVGYVAVQLIDGKTLNRITSDRTERVEDTLRVVEEKPLTGIGIGGQPSASRRLAHSERPTLHLRLAYHPADRGRGARGARVRAVRAAAGGGAWVIRQVRKRDEALGLALGASLLALFVHALSYSGFLEDPLTWLVLGVAAGSLAWSRAHETPPPAAERARARMASA